MAVNIGNFVRGAFCNHLSLITSETLCVVTSFIEDKPNLVEVKILGASPEARKSWGKYLKNSNYIGRKYIVNKSKLTYVKLRQATE